jgi:hypothetical protein
MIDEEILFSFFTLQPRLQQEERITKYCSEIEEQIKNAGSMQTGEHIVKKPCEQFQSNCHSEILQRQLVTYTNNLIERYWGK